MSIEYKITRFEPQLNCASDPNCDDVTAVVVGMTGTDTETGTSAYIDESFKLEPCMPPDELNAKAETMVKEWANARNWYVNLQRQIYQRDMAPRPMPDDYTKPDFSNVTLGAEYSEMVINENNINDQELVEEVFGDALPTPTPAEEPTEAPETPAE